MLVAVGVGTNYYVCKAEGWRTERMVDLRQL